MKTLGLALLLSLLSLTARAEVVALTGATVHTMGPAGTIENGTVVIENGRVRAVGKNVAVPAGARQIDARGKVVTPGLFDSISRIGLVEVSAVEGSADTAVEDDRYTAAFNVADGLNPRSTLIPINRVLGGLTRTLVMPQNGNSLIAGQGVLIHLGTEQGDYLLRSPAAMLAVVGEGGAQRTGGARGAAMLRLREVFQDALDYAKNRTAFESGDRRDYSVSRLDLEALQPVVRGEMPLVVGVERASDIEALLRLAKEYRLKLILADATEAWMVADQIAAAKVPVLVNALNNLPASFERLGATLENAARLQKAGVTVAFMSGDAHTAYNLRQAAGNAVAYGLPWDAALAAMTTVPARIWGIDDHYGTLEPGKDADVVVWDGDPLDVTSAPEHVFIRGVEVPMETRQTKLRDRYKDLGSSVLPAYRKP
jgi:imidazolonepropionase-like amidohydrolase